MTPSTLRDVPLDRTSTLEVEAVEVCNGDKLVGYAIFFSGGWDGYVFFGRIMQRVVCGAMKHEAIHAVKEFA